MPVSHDTLIRFIYGELSPDDARQVTLELERDPGLRALVEEQRKIKARLETAERNVPADSKAEPESTPRKFIALRGSGARNIVAAAAAAAGLVLGILFADSLGLGSPIKNDNGALIAGGALASALSSQLSSAEGGDVRIASSFWSTRASFCRSFVMRGRAANRLAGIACREGSGWRIVSLGDAAAPQQNAADNEDDLPPLIQGSVSALIAGEPLDDNGERAARSQNWRAR